MITVSVKTGETLTAPTTIPTVSGYEFKGWRTKDGKPYDFTVAPTGKFTLYANWEKIPDPKPEPEPEPEAPTYTLTVKGGTFTYNGGEAMTSASVPVDAEVKVTLNQSAVPEGMVFDLWAMDEASLLGNPAVAYNEESFTIPAGTVAKNSIVTVEAQYRDATIESEPSILGTAAIIGVAGAGTAVIVWQGYRIGMELYEKYFQPTPEEDAVVEPTLESQMTDPIFLKAGSAPLSLALLDSPGCGSQQLLRAIALAPCWPLPQQLLPQSATGGGRRRCPQRESS